MPVFLWLDLDTTDCYQDRDKCNKMAMRERERERERERRGIENADLQNLDRRVLCQLFSIPSLNITGNQRYKQEK